MTIAINLLISAMTLLTMVQQNPNLPQSFKDTATGIANQAIVVAQDEIAKANQTATTPVVINTPVQTVQQPTFGGIITPMETTIDKSDLLVDLLSNTQADVKNNIPYGSWIYKVSVLNSKGAYTKDASVSFVSDDNLYKNEVDLLKTTNAQNGNPKDGKWYTSFEYIPTSTGSKTLTFTSGNLSKTITINVK